MSLYQKAHNQPAKNLNFISSYEIRFHFNKVFNLENNFNKILII